MIRIRESLFVLSSLLLASCLSSDCPTGFVASGGRCVPADSDAGAKTPCGGACTGATPICDSTTNTCVGCLSATDCTAPGASSCDPAAHACVACLSASDCTDATKPLCEPSSHACVACLSASDCTDATKPLCDPSSHACVACVSAADCTDATKPTCDADTHTCRSCTTDTDCDGITGRSVCDSGKCVQCTTATEATACGDTACDASTHTCTTTLRHSLHGCDFCKASSECALGLVCMTTDAFDTTSAPVCLPAVAGGSQCPVLASTDPNVSFYAAWIGSSVEGATTADCGVPASCVAYRRYRSSPRTSCAFDSDCANPNGPYPDGAGCSTVGKNKGTCTLLCGDSAPYNLNGTSYVPCQSPDACMATGTAGRYECATP